MSETHSRRFRVSRRENLEWTTLACLSGANFRQALPLCVVRAFVDKNNTTTVAANTPSSPPKIVASALPESRWIFCRAQPFLAELRFLHHGTEYPAATEVAENATRLNQ